MGSFWSQSFPPPSKFNVSDIPDLSGKAMIVTGGNSGIGKEIIRALLSHDAKVYMASRNAAKAKAAIDELKKDTGKEAIFLQLDLASFKSIRKATDEFLSKERELHALFHNGGVLFMSAVPGNLDVTEEGYDIQWGTHVVGPFYLTQLLMPALIAAGENTSSNKARVTFTASIVQRQTINFDVVIDSPARKKMSPDHRYGQSKFANVVMAREFARRYGDKGIVFTSLNPGNLRTNLQHHMNSIAKKLVDLVMYPAPMGALTPLWAGTSADGVDLNGKYLIPWARVGEPSSASQDPELGQQLWLCLWLDKQVGEKST